LIKEGFLDDGPRNEGRRELLNKQMKDISLLKPMAAVYYISHLLTCGFLHVFQISRASRNCHNNVYAEGRAYRFCEEQINSRPRKLLSVYK
jgi:hypothetical protein